MKKALLLVFSLMFSTNCFASSGKVEQVFDAQSLSGTGSTITSKIFNVGSVYRMGFWLKPNKAATKEGSAVKLWLEGAYADTPSSIFATMPSVLLNSYGQLTTTAAVATAETIATVPAMKYIRFVAQGATGNATGTTVTMYMFTQEQN